MEAFTVGALLGDVFFHSIPHLVEEIALEKSEYSFTDWICSQFFILISGILGCYAIEVISNKVFGAHSHSHEEVIQEKEVKNTTKKETSNKNALGDLKNVET